MGLLPLTVVCPEGLAGGLVPPSYCPAKPKRPRVAHSGERLGSGCVKSVVTVAMSLWLRLLVVSRLTRLTNRVEFGSFDSDASTIDV